MAMLEELVATDIFLKMVRGASSLSIPTSNLALPCLYTGIALFFLGLFNDVTNQKIWRLLFNMTLLSLAFIWRLEIAHTFVKVLFTHKNANRMLMALMTISVMAFWSQHIDKRYAASADNPQEQREWCLVLMTSGKSSTQLAEQCREMAERALTPK